MFTVNVDIHLMSAVRYSNLGVPSLIIIVIRKISFKFLFRMNFIFKNTKKENPFT